MAAMRPQRGLNALIATLIITKIMKVLDPNIVANFIPVKKSSANILPKRTNFTFTGTVIDRA